MSKKLTSIYVSVLISSPQLLHAQDIAVSEPVEIISTQPLKKSKVIRNVEPVPYWVDAEQLSIRDNPVAGDVIGMLELGQKIKAYEQFENWIRITKNTANSKWVNVEYLTNTPVTWARYDKYTLRRNYWRTALGNDITLKRIKVSGDRSARIYAASVKESKNGNRIIVTRQNFRAGPYFEKRLVACSEDKATHVQVLGEGYSYMMMENDIRSQGVDVNKVTPSFELAGKSDISPATVAVANFSCSASI